MFTRRQFINALGAAAAAGYVTNFAGNALGQTSDFKDFFDIPQAAMKDPVFSFTSGHFIPFINSDFEVSAGDARRSEALRLLDVKDIEYSANAKRGVAGDCFSLIFSNPRGTKLNETRLEFKHYSLGTFTLTILPVNAEPNLYEAIINHLRL